MRTHVNVDAEFLLCLRSNLPCAVSEVHNLDARDLCAAVLRTAGVPSRVVREEGVSFETLHALQTKDTE